VLPAAARAIARALPPALERRLGEGFLSALDAGALRPSNLPTARRQALARSFAMLAARLSPGMQVRLVHRRAAGPFAMNAFALPGGTVVLLDGIPEATAGQQVSTAVLAHELCHVAGRDPTRGLLQATGLVAAAGLVCGDSGRRARRCRYSYFLIRSRSTGTPFTRWLSTISGTSSTRTWPYQTPSG
jgi:Zn-dependent protease with chaperone function